MFILIGLGVFCLFIGSAYLYSNAFRGEKLEQISQPISFDEESNSEGIQLAQTMDYRSISVPTIDEVAQAPAINTNAVEAILRIPSIGLEMNVLTGTNQQNLLYGATTGLAIQQAGKGNYVLFGHNMERSGILFSDLNQVAVGNQILLDTREGETFVYQVTNSFVVDKKDTSVLESTDDSIITLITCSSSDPEGKNHNFLAGTTPYRLVVQGELIE